MLSRPSTNATGMVIRSTARPRSATMRIRRRGRRSTQTPANRLNSAVGVVSTAASRPISTGPACSVITAVSGTARSVIWSPKSEMVWPIQNFRKSPSRQRLVTSRSVGWRDKGASKPQGVRVVFLTSSGLSMAMVLRQGPHGAWARARRIRAARGGMWLRAPVRHLGRSFAIVVVATAALTLHVGLRPAASATGTFVQYTYSGPAGSRTYYVDTPVGYTTSERVPLIVMLHGCNGNAVDFSNTTQMNALADGKQFIVAYPEQSSTYSGCWAWTSTANQARGLGEPAIIAGITHTVIGDTSHWNMDA